MRDDLWLDFSNERIKSCMGNLNIIRGLEDQIDCAVNDEDLSIIKERLEGNKAAYHNSRDSITNGAIIKEIEQQVKQYYYLYHKKCAQLHFENQEYSKCEEDLVLAQNTLYDLFFSCNKYDSYQEIYASEFFDNNQNICQLNKKINPEQELRMCIDVVYIAKNLRLIPFGYEKYIDDCCQKGIGILVENGNSVDNNIAHKIRFEEVRDKIREENGYKGPHGKKSSVCVML